MKKMKFRYSQPVNSNTFELGAHRATPGRALVDAIALTAEVCGQALSPAAAELLAGDLADFNEPVILSALARCRMELQGRLKVADILARVEDGRPGADEAWEMMPDSELASVVWTNEMAKSWGVALPLLSEGDVARAHVAFRDAYEKAVLEARLRKEPVRWVPSLGIDVAGRQRVLLDAVKKRRLSAAHVEQLLPADEVSAVAEEAIGRVRLKNLH